jgi:thiol:disulfide interchange protein
MLLGVFSGFLTTPCAGPVLIAVLTFASTTGSIFLSTLLLFMYSLGIITIILLFMLFSKQMQKLITRVSKIGVQRIARDILAALIFILALYYLSLAIGPSLFFTQTSSFRQVLVTQNIPILTSLKDAVTASKKNNKPILISFTASWCLNCHKLDRLLATHPMITKLLKSYNVVILDLTEQNSNNDEIVREFSVRGLPYLIALDTERKRLFELSYSISLDHQGLITQLKAYTLQK